MMISEEGGTTVFDTHLSFHGELKMDDESQENESIIFLKPNLEKFLSSKTVGINVFFLFLSGFSFCFRKSWFQDGFLGEGEVVSLRSSRIVKSKKGQI